MAALATWFTPSLSVISRSKGSSAVASAAYRACQNLYDKLYQKFHDYTPKRGQIYTAIFGNFAGDIEALWNAAEAADTRKNSRTAREIMIPLPDEWTEEQRKEYAKAVSEMLYIEYGVAGQFSLHAPNSKNKNHHVHILFTTREVINSEFGKKTRILDEGKKNGEVTNLRNRIADIMNKFAEKFGSDFFVTGGKFVEFDEDHVPTKNIPINSTPERRAELEEYNRNILDQRGRIKKLDNDLVQIELETNIVHKVQKEYLEQQRVKKKRLSKSISIESCSQIVEISSSVKLENVSSADEIEPNIIDTSNILTVETLSPAPSEYVKPVIDEIASSPIVEIKPFISENVILNTDVDGVEQDEYYDIEAEAFRIKSIFDGVLEKKSTIRENSRMIDSLKNQIKSIETYKPPLIENAFESVVHFIYPLLEKVFNVNDPIEERKKEVSKLNAKVENLKKQQIQLKSFCARPEILEACTKWQCNPRYAEIIDEFRKQSPDYKNPHQPQKQIEPASSLDYSDHPHHINNKLYVSPKPPGYD